MRSRQTISRNEFFLRITSGAFLRKAIFAVACVMTFLGSSFVPATDAEYGKGSVEAAGELIGIDLVETLPDTKELFYTVYRVQKGDTVSGIAEANGVTWDSIISLNSIQAARSIQPGQLLKIPNMTGILYTAQEGDTVDSIAAAYNISADRVIETNRLLKDVLDPDEVLFLPDARMPSSVLREISGDLFRWPVRGYVTSWYSWRRDPFTGKQAFHTGLDIGVPMRTPVRAGMDGTVSDTGFSSIMGNYVLLSHGGGWKSLYAHLDSISVQRGQYVTTSTKVGLSGTSGYSTGPHLHFTVYKNGKLVNPANVLQ